MTAPPLYASTRGHGPVALVDALLQGLAPDGGLYLPEHLPALTLPEAGPLADIGPQAVAPWLPAGDPAPVGDTFAFDTPLVAAESLLGSGGFLLDLTRGPTAAFKDVGARFLARVLSALAPHTEGPVRTVLVATSGDTGGAVAAAFHGVPGFRVVVLFPAEGVSPRQRRQFTTLGDDVVALGVDGPFDACQRLVKEALARPDWREPLRLTSANSINIGRLIPQTTWFVKAFADLRGRGAPLFVVPSGNLGHLTAGLMAAEMLGAPARFLAAVNDNDAFLAWREGRPPRTVATVPTPSTAMDVGRPSNLERIDALVARRPGLDERIEVRSVSAAATMATMQAAHAETGRFLDPHTAVGVAALRARERETGRWAGPRVVLATADAGKFPDTVREATGRTPPVPSSLEGLDDRTERWSPIPPRIEALGPFLGAAATEGDR